VLAGYSYARGVVMARTGHTGPIKLAKPYKGMDGM
jgi:hypothetical protein